ncbi:MAG: DUF2480 family protein [Bacteroidota bacterium]
MSNLVPINKDPRGLVTLDLEEFYHHGEHVIYDLRQNLFQDSIIREEEFRAFVSDYDWSQYEDKNVVITCSANAIIPTWTYMLLSSAIAPYANYVYYGDISDINDVLFKNALSKLDIEQFRNERVVLKGCGSKKVPLSAYVDIVRLLQPVVQSIMYGDPCSTVPIYRRPSKK